MSQLGHKINTKPYFGGDMEKIITISTIAKTLSAQLKKAGWRIVIDDDYDDFKLYMAYNDKPLVEVFTAMHLLMMTLGNDRTKVEVRFTFFAEPRIFLKIKDSAKRRKEIKDSLQTLCDNFFKKGRIDAKLDWVKSTCLSKRKVNFDGKGLRPGLEVELAHFVS